MFLKEFTDQIQHTFTLSAIPKKIISLVPSQTELLHYLDLEEEVIGITKFCVHPKEWLSSKQKIGGTKNLNLELIKSLQPDLIIANKEENLAHHVRQLQKQFCVYTSDVNTFNDALQMITDIGKMTDTNQKTEQLIQEITIAKEQFESTHPKTKKTCAYLIWQEPFMTVGNNTFIHEMITIFGLQNSFEQKDRYPEVTLNELKEKQLDYLLLSTEPFPFKEEHLKKLQQELPNTKVMLVDGEMFSWYGNRLLKCFPYFSQLRNQYYI